MYNDNQNNPQDFRPTGRGRRGGMHGGRFAADDMRQDGQGMAQCRRHGGNGGRGRNGQGYGQAMGQCQRRSGMSQSRSTLPGSAPANPAGDGTDD